MIFYLLIPFLNILTKNMNRKQHLQLVGLCLLVYSVIGSIPKISLNVNYVSWFVVLYFIASYIRLYGFPLKISSKYWGGLAIISILVSVISVVFMVWLSSIFICEKVPIYWFVSDSNRIMAVATAICSFMFFKDLNIKHSKLINIMGGSTFGVLLIHANSDTMRRWLWQDILNNVGQYATETLVLHAFFSVFLIFFVCILIDRMRVEWIEKIIFKLLDRYIDKFSIVKDATIR